jgi:hypothetical protein
MSSWWLFSALGIYPLQVGSPTYVIGSPLFRRATVRLENGKRLVINAPKNGPDNVYVQGLRVNGRPTSRTWLTHDVLAAGATLDFDMGPAPSSWGTGPDDVPPSVTSGDLPPSPMRDLASAAAAEASASDGTDLAALFDDTSLTQVTFTAANPSVQLDLGPEPAEVVFYTMTSGTDAAADPTGWVLRGSSDGITWTVLDQRSDETFRWRRQTRPFKVASPGAYSFYRLELTCPPSTVLAELELLARPPAGP